jgi:hypothetical protein
MITRNFTQTGQLVTSGQHFASNEDAIKIKLIRLLRKIKGEDPYDRLNGIDLSVLMHLASTNSALFSRYASDYLITNMPELQNVISVSLDLDSEIANVQVIVETQKGVIVEI